MTASPLNPFSRIKLTYAQKLFFTATVPLLLAAAAISVVVVHQSRQMSEREIAALETQLIDAKKAELKNYLSLARTAFLAKYGRALPDDEAAKVDVSQILSSMIYGQDGYFFVYDYDGTNLVSPRQTEFINRNWAGLTDSNGTQVVDRLIELARTGGGYHSYLWTKPSTGDQAQMVSYVIGLQDWKWVVGTGIFIDDIQKTVAASRAQTEARVTHTFQLIGVITMAAVLLVFMSGLVINIRERRLADAKLKQLTQRIFDTQEEERGRVARELHDSISQMLVGVRYMMELTARRLKLGDSRAHEGVEKSISGLNGAIQEVRRISRDLRPGVLDDLGLGPALHALTEEFEQRTGIRTDFRTVVFRNLLDQESKIALYRVAQEALTNIERHSGADHVTMDLRGDRLGARLRIEDNGRGFETDGASGAVHSGLGLRNMQERMEQLDGTLRLLSTRSGALIEARVPLTHMLQTKSKKRISA
ncbi:integral membrane sensor signal transduction histidine kinase [Actibacterium atlanticum]|uniref:Integral membrane sensor signal transduction histidine kinase n=1 Tax=Actibacterium atlanticum TaxID=1461693 RepID=A0A058ZPD9_9RHOB|nr:cache domain-containing protein [Actibacterium atlanticum]KCV83438.1 integral membrane sensor signal transduction histidine kinase [Actibacterium atlanticum]